MGQDNAIYKFSIKLSLSTKGQNKSKLHKQTSNILISIVMAAWYNYRNDINLVCFDFTSYKKIYFWINV